MSTLAISHLLEIRALRAGYGQGDVLLGISLKVGKGEVVTLLGRNGAGKSTTIKSVIGLVKPTSGHIMFRGRSLTPMGVHEIARLGIGYVPEERRIFPRLTVEENLRVTRRSSGEGSTWEIDRVYRMFPKLAELRHRSGGSLSGGEQQMLAIARTLMGGPDLLLLDEPSEGLAPLVVRSLIDQIAQLKAGGLAILLCEQNISFARALSDRVCIVDKGEVRFNGTFETLDQHQELKRAYLFVGRATRTDSVG